MLALNNGARALRYWRSQMEQQREYASPVDKAALAAQLHAMRPDLAAPLADLHRAGVASIEGYWPAERCATARNELDRMILDYPQSVHHSSNGSDKRMFGVEMVGEACSLFHHDAFLRTVGEMEGGYGLYNFVTLGARIDATSANNGSGDGWHRDAFGYQFKAILYLCDVTDDNGPFEYISGTQKPWRTVLDTVLERVPVPPNSRLDNDKINALVAKGTLRTQRFKAKAGTLLLVNTTGIHRGVPLKSGNRYALTNYYYHPFQIGKSTVENFLPLLPGVEERVEPLLEIERMAQQKRLQNEMVTK